MRLLDRFRRPDRVRTKQTDEAEGDKGQLPNKIEPPVSAAAAVSEESLPHRASEEDAA